ncbi:expressed unknown protein [Seminavis robusta]|uniref:Uncharacterized protein n=1 Tax=Seminavis robusta TaxID=568900 RepID=A0A9N8HWS3_9STRA|nr:expressed unknown protein [Seminavis robusta]|eukprot:Sro2769_g336701.1  (517) ;mRNA; r:3716-5266
MPTIYGSMTPSQVPSTAPTGVLDGLLESLPEYTTASMNNGSDTPQWKAWQWLAYHQNITFLPEWRKEQLFALATFFYAFGGENWNPFIQERWMDDAKEECQWFSSGFGFLGLDGEYVELQDYGIEPTFPCDSHGKFTSLFLEDQDLSGLSPFIPPEIALLTSLSILQLGVNGIAGPILSFLPTQLYRMTSLTIISLWDNLELTGNIPSELGLLTDLTVLGLTATKLTGTIPEELCFVPDLQFDCTPDLCGCYCGCWPGQFPTTAAAVMVNIRTDQNPWHNTWAWQQESNTTAYAWDTWESGGPLEFQSHLYSSLFTVNPNTSYRLVVSDIARNGLSSGGIGFEYGWITLTAANAVLYSHLGSHTSGFSDLTIDILVGADGSFDTSTPPGWPGRFPSMVASVLLNIETDGFPSNTSWVWKQQAELTADMWDSVESDGPLAFHHHLFSALFTVSPNTVYRLVVSDSSGFGFFSSGWLTLTAANATILYSYESKFSEVTIDISVGSNGSLDITNTTTIL